MSQPAPSRRALLLGAASAMALGLAALVWWQVDGAAGVGTPGTRVSSVGRESPTLLRPERPPVPDERADAAKPDSVEERPAAAATPAESGAASGPFRGLVLDVATGEPVGRLRMVTGAVSADVDAGGRFECAEPFSAVAETIAFHDVFQGTHVRSVARDALERPDEEGWIARIAVGPTYRVRIAGVGPGEIDAWRARLVETLEDGTEAAGGWVGLRPGDPEWMRYDNPWEPNAPESSFHLEVRDADGTRQGASGVVTSAIGVYPTVLTIVPDELLASLSGRALDTAGNGKGNARVTVVPLGHPGADDGEGWAETTTSDDGRFRISALIPGSYRVHVRPRRGEPPQFRDVDVPPGGLVLEDFVFRFQEGAGRIEGRLLSAAGRELDDRQLVRLRSVDGSGVDLLDVSSPSRSQMVVVHGGFLDDAELRLLMEGRRGRDAAEEGADALVFEFAEVPAGEYELSVVPRGPFPWSPARIQVSPPNTEVVFVREDDVPLVAFTLRAVDAESGAELGALELQLQVGRAWDAGARRIRSGEPFAELPADARLRWTVRAPGHAPASGDELAFEPTPGGRVAEVALEPGWGARLVLRDLGGGFDLDDRGGALAALEAPPVAGARVLADGRLAGTSDATGTVRIAGPREPERIEILHPGWRVAPSAGFRDGRIVGEAPDVVVWMAPR